MTSIWQIALHSSSEMAPYFRKYWLKISIGAFLTVASISFSLVVPLLSRLIIDHGLLRHDIHTINLLGVLFLLVAVLSFGATAWRQYLFAALQQQITLEMRSDLSRHILHLPMSYLDGEAPGSWISRVDGDVGNLAGLMSDKFINTVCDVLSVICAICILVYLNWKLAILIAILVPVFLISVKSFSRQTYEAAKSARELAEELLSRLEEIMASIHLLKVFNTEDEEIDSYDEIQRRSASVNLQLTRIDILASLAIGGVVTASPLIVIWYGGLQVVHGDMSIGSLFAFNMYLAYLFGPLRSVFDSVMSFHSSLASLKRITEISAHPGETIAMPKNGLPESIGVPTIELRSVSFSYKGSHGGILRDVSMRADAGSVTAIVGRSGEGKTTILHLLMRLYDQYDGEISFDGREIRTIDLKTLRRTIRIVPTEPVLLNRTVFENIAYGVGKISPEDVYRACRAAMADEFIKKLPQGYLTVVGNRAVMLSAGEKQRLALARALVSNPRILLLDEATAFLDSTTEYEVQKAMESSMRGRTCIVVAHRLNTVRNANMICVLKDGVISDSGTHVRLYHQSAEYRDLVDRQFVAGTPNHPPQAAVMAAERIAP